jgi:hypothetical protein
MRSSLGDARRTRRRVTPRASTAQHRERILSCDAMRCVSRVEVEPQEACLSNLLRTSFADRARMISSSSSRARSGRGRDERHRNETKKKQKKSFFYAGHKAGSHRAGYSASSIIIDLGIATSEALPRDVTLGTIQPGAAPPRLGTRRAEYSITNTSMPVCANARVKERDGEGCDSSRRPGSDVRFSLGCETFSKTGRVEDRLEVDA